MVFSGFPLTCSPSRGVPGFLRRIEEPIDGTVTRVVFCGWHCCCLRFGDMEVHTLMILRHRLVAWVAFKGGARISAFSTSWVFGCFVRARVSRYVVGRTFWHFLCYDEGPGAASFLPPSGVFGRGSPTFFVTAVVGTSCWHGLGQRGFVSWMLRWLTHSVGVFLKLNTVAFFALRVICYVKCLGSQSAATA